MSQGHIEQLDAAISSNRKTIEQGKALARLLVNKDFKEVILKGYFEREAVRLVHLRADPNMQSAESQASIIKQMDAISGLSDYLRVQEHLCEQATKQLAADEEFRAELAQEELE
tara:strand:+ start:973 stop:1314 length:342 start_codon:yes stop_codon:yes gene_type:complete